MKVAVIVNTLKNEAIDFLPIVIDKLITIGISPLIMENTKIFYNSDKVTYCSCHKEIVKECDVVITIGGDGTIIHMARHCAEYNKPLLGINFGRVGFVATIEPDEIDKLSMLLTGEYVSQSRMLLKVTVENNNDSECLYAMNDAVISRGSLSRMMDLSVSVNDEKICDYRADGIIFSTQTGSTAYSLSAGGPVISPDIECILLTPICPHSLFSRSVIFKENDILKVQSISGSSPNSEAFLTVDGQYYLPLHNDTRITIKKYEKPFTLISMEPKNFYTVLNDKLNERG